VDYFKTKLSERRCHVPCIILRIGKWSCSVRGIPDYQSYPLLRTLIGSWLLDTDFTLCRVPRNYNQQKNNRYSG
jgi:hypothetical protein